jgi:hypothetical protein
MSATPSLRAYARAREGVRLAGDAASADELRAFLKMVRVVMRGGGGEANAMPCDNGRRA